MKLFSTKLKESGISKTELADRLGLGLNTVSGWGESPPQYALAYLELLCNVFDYSGLSKHHRIWLDAHPDREDYWLCWMLREGFQIHHIDGDHGNNDPGNLVLIESGDHKFLHGKKRLKSLRERKSAQRLEAGKLGYNLRKNGESWNTINMALRKQGLPQGSDQVRVYAIENDLEWPIAHRSDCTCQKCKTGKYGWEKKAG